MHRKMPERGLEMKRQGFTIRKRGHWVWQMRCVQALANKNPIWVGVGHQISGVERKRRGGGENPVSLTITAIILMWPTFMTFCKFFLIDGNVNLDIRSVWFLMRVCHCSNTPNTLCAFKSKGLGIKCNFILTRPFGINTVISMGIPCSLLEIKLPTHTPWRSIYPVIRALSKHHVSSGHFEAVCLHIATVWKDPGRQHSTAVMDTHL